MDPISLILLAVNGIRTVIANPALGGGSSVKFDEASELLGILGVLIGQGADGMDDLKKFTETIESMAAQGRAPSSAEWDIMRGRSDDAHARLQAAKEELLGEEEVDDEVPTDPEPEPEPTPEPAPEPEPEVVEEDPTVTEEPEAEADPEPPPTG
jgi:hypothetical protein